MENDNKSVQDENLEEIAQKSEVEQKREELENEFGYLDKKEDEDLDLLDDESDDDKDLDLIEPEKVKSKVPNGVIKRLKVMTKQKYELQSQVETLNRRLTEIENSGVRGREQNSSNETVLKKPDILDYNGADGFDKYEEAKEEYYVQKAALALEQKLEKKKSQNSTDSIDFKFKKNVERAREEYGDDWHRIEKLNPQLPNHINEFVKESDLGPDILVYLDKNPKKIEKMVNLSTSQQIKFLVECENKVAEAKKIKTSNAPTPIDKPNSQQQGQKLTGRKIEDYNLDELDAYLKKTTSKPF